MDTDPDRRPVPRPETPVEPVVVHSSIRGLIAAVVSPAVLIALGGAASSGGLRVLPVATLTLGVVLAVGVAVDFPRRTHFDAAGMTRVCALRRQRLAWEDTVAIERAPPTSIDRVRNLTDRRDDPMISGGLVARGPGRKRWLLTDRVESQAEFDAVVAILRARNGATVVRAERPPSGAAPTDLYRRRRRGVDDG
jgi:hypothetical protein